MNKNSINRSLLANRSFVGYLSIFFVHILEIFLVLLSFLQKALKRYEDKPEGIITQQALHESVYLIRGRDDGIPAWHHILVPANKLADLTALPAGSNLDVTAFGRHIQYRNKSGITLQMSGWGRDPSKMIETWMKEHYGQ
jgi:hypothetical protein